MYYNFFDMPYFAYPADGKYYFNILIIEVIVPEGDMNYDYWDISHILDPKPYIYHFYEDKDVDEVCISFIPHTVIETRDNGEISYYDMFTEDEFAEDDEDEDDDFDEYAEFNNFLHCKYKYVKDWWGFDNMFPA